MSTTADTSIRRIPGLLALSALSFTAFLAAASAAEVRILPPGAIAFKADANVPGVSVALVDGNPKEGPYTVRARFAPNVKIPAHFHPDTRVVTVISGTYYFGQGDRYDEKAIKGYGPGTVIVVPANTPHYAGSAEDGPEVQESGVGPTGITLTGK
jgi:quercetin dioxygenase-like cupin family protein